MLLSLAFVLPFQGVSKRINSFSQGVALGCHVAAFQAWIRPMLTVGSSQPAGGNQLEHARVVWTTNRLLGLDLVYQVCRFRPSGPQKKSRMEKLHS
jgi:hypothetical protein